MPSMKIYPLAQLPDRDVTETQFNIWQEELEAYLVQEKDFAVFLKDGSYDEWESYETNNNRIQTLPFYPGNGYRRYEGETLVEKI